MKVLKDKTLYDYQKKTLDLMNKNNKFCLFLEQGLGKTLIGFCDIARKIHSHNVKNVLVVAPAGVMKSWGRYRDYLTDEASTLLESINYKVYSYSKIAVLDGFRKTLSNSFDVKVNKNKGNVEIEYSKVNKDKTITTKRRKMKLEDYELLSTKFDYILLDEGQKIKRPKSNVFKALSMLGINTKYKYLLTGTPITNEELLSAFAYDCFLYPKMNGGYVGSQYYGSKTNFLNNHAQLNEYYSPKSYHNVGDIMNRLKSISIRLLKKDCLDLPDMLPMETYTVEMTTKQKKYYKQMHKNGVINEFDIMAESAGVRMNMCRQLASGFIYETQYDEYFNPKKVAHKVGTNKTTLLDEYFEDNKTPVVIFYNFNESLADIISSVEKAGRSYYTLNGASQNKDIWRDFQKDDTNVMIVNYGTGAQGIELFKARTTIFYEPTLSSEVLEQAKARTHRIGIKDPSRYIMFETEKSVEEKINNCLENYIDFNLKIFKKSLTSYSKGDRI